MVSENIEKVDFTKLEQEVMSILMKHASDNKELESDLFHLIDSIKCERKKLDEIKSLTYNLASKI